MWLFNDGGSHEKWEPFLILEAFVLINQQQINIKKIHFYVIIF